MCLCLPVLPSQLSPKLCRSAASIVLPLILQSKPLIVLWKSLREWLPNDLQGLKLGLKLKLCCLTYKLQRFYLLLNP